MKVGCVYYTDSQLDPALWRPCLAQLRRCLEAASVPVVSVSLAPLDLGENLVLKLRRGAPAMFHQILAGLERLAEEGFDAAFLAEHDVLYHPSHFAFRPERPDTFYYNRSQWHVWVEDGRAFNFPHNDPSQLAAELPLLIRHYQAVCRAVDRDGYHWAWGFSPPRGQPEEAQVGSWLPWYSALPNVDLRHRGSLTKSQLSPSDFRQRPKPGEWVEARAVPGWGETLGRVPEFLAALGGEA